MNHDNIEKKVLMYLKGSLTALELYDYLGEELGRGLDKEMVVIKDIRKQIDLVKERNCAHCGRVINFDPYKGDNYCGCWCV